MQGLYRWVERQGWLDKAGAPMQKAIAGLWSATGTGGEQVKELFHGRPLGHPLHPALVSIPIGAWSLACIFDALSLTSAKLRPAADTSIGIGLAGAATAALTGLTDWEHTTGDARRVGVAHALLNTAATVLYIASLRHRMAGRRGMGMLSSALGYGIANVSAALGGHLSYDKGIGVNHGHGQEGPEHWVSVAPETVLREGEPYRVDAAGTPVVLVRDQGRVYALSDSCSHLGGPLAEGRVEDGCIVCPWHGSKFTLRDGAIERGPAVYEQPVLDVRIRAGHIELRRRGSTSKATDEVLTNRNGVGTLAGANP